MTGHTIGSYRILNRIGEGGMGTVYRGLDLMLDRTVAIKALRADLAGNTDLAERFRLEAKAVARLQHPNVAGVYALQREGDHLYLVMEFIEGETFEEKLRREARLHPADAVPLVMQALAGLGHAHAQGVVHRDIKPANLMLTPHGTVKIMDFGIARLLGGQRVTRTRFAVGTAEYMAPEQVKGGEVDGRTDLYALGTVLYEMLTGQVPFHSKSEFELMRSQVEEAPPRLRTRLADAPEALEDVLDRALAKNPDDRYASADAFRDALAALTLPPRPARTAGPTRVFTPPAPPKPADAAVHAAATRVVENLSATAPMPAPPTRIADRSEAFAPVVANASSAPLLRRPAVWGASVAAVAMLVVLAFVLTRPSPSTDVPSAPAAQEDASDPVDFARRAEAAMRAQDPITPAPSSPTFVPTPGARPAVMLLASAERFFARDALTSPADSNAADVLARVLAVEPGNTQARALVRRIVEKYRGWGAVQERRDRPADAARHYRAGLAVANRFPAVAGDLAAGLQNALSTATASAQTPRATPSTSDKAEPTPATPSADAPAQTGTLRVLVRPYGDVFVDDKKVASNTIAAVTLTLPAGPHTVRAVHPTLGSTERRVTIRPGALEDVRIVLEN